MGTHDYGSQGWRGFTRRRLQMNGIFLMNVFASGERASERGRSEAGSAAEITLREADGRWARRSKRRRSKRYGRGAAATLTVAKHSIDTFFGIQHV